MFSSRVTRALPPFKKLENPKSLVDVELYGQIVAHHVLDEAMTIQDEKAVVGDTFVLLEYAEPLAHFVVNV